MKPGAFVLNVARGGIVDEAALATALREGRLGGAAIDVFEHEPPTGSPLLDAPNTVLTPHLGASTAEAQVAVAEEIAEQVLDVLDGRPAQYAVNAPLLSAEAEQTIGPYLPLAEMLGRFLAQFARAGRRHVHGRARRRPRREPRRRRSPPPPCAASSRRARRSGSTSSTPAILAKARGIAVVERRTTDAAGFPAAITVSGTVKGGDGHGRAARSPGGEMRLVRLNDYRLDMAVAELMLITRHRDRPGTIGRIGQLLGAADVNISAMHLARSAPRADALMILSVDDDVPPALEAALRADEGVHDLWTIRLGAAAMTESALIPGRPRRRSLAFVRHGESELVAQGRFQGQADSPLTELGRRQALLDRPAHRAPNAAARPAAAGRRAARDRPLPAPRADRDRDAHRARRERRPRRCGRRGAGAAPSRRRACSRSARASGRGCRARRSSSAGATCSPRGAASRSTAWAPGGESLADVDARVRPALRQLLADLAIASPAGRGAALPGPRLRRRPVRRAVVDRRRARRRVQGRAARPARPAARAVLDAAVRAVRHHGRRDPERPAPAPPPQRDRPPRRPRGASKTRRAERDRAAGRRRALAAPAPAVG